MKTNSKALASFLAAAVWADGEYCEFEQSLVVDMGELLDAKTLTEYNRQNEKSDFAKRKVHFYKLKSTPFFIHFSKRSIAI